MKFVLAPDSYKESISATKAVLAMEKGILSVFPNAECVRVPMADGGEGIVEALINGTNGRVIWKKVTGPLQAKVNAAYGILGDGITAVIEMASASGLQLIKFEDRNPLITTTYGTGELVLDALNHGVERILIGIGGSATNDGGAGMLQALGVSFRDEDGNELTAGGGALNRLATIDVSGLDKRLANVKIDVACDVTNPLTGRNGASYIFGPQKGATEEMVQLLEANLKHYSLVIERGLGKNVDGVAGAGAAGGLGAGLLAFLSADLKRGVDLVIEHTALKEKMEGATYVFTGEGSIDKQTLYGKTLFGVAQVAKELNIPVIAFAGRIGEGTEELYNHGFTAIIGIIKEVSSLEDVLDAGELNLCHSVENVCRVIQAVR